LVRCRLENIHSDEAAEYVIVDTVGIEVL